jgi:imidazolonepropionase-like amidohydrolase
VLALIGGRVIDGLGSGPTGPVVILIDPPRIRAVGPADRVVIPEGTERIEIHGSTVLPGLLDLHAHLCWKPNLVDRLVAAREDPLTPDSVLALWGSAHATALLQAGFTTVRDGFAWHGRFTSLALREAIADGAIKGPRIVAAGYAGMTGTEVDIRMSPNVPRPYGVAADGPWELRKRVRECVRDGYDWIKTFTSGGRVAGGQEEDVWYVSHTSDEMNALVDEAHRFGTRVMVHATTRDAIALAVNAGADTVEHGWPLDDELIELMLKKGIALVPTISVYSERGFLRDGVEAPLRARAQRQFESRMGSFRRAYEAGVTIAAGTDVIPSMPTMTPGESAFELTMMVRQGMRPLDAIRAATSVPAQLLGMEGSIGSVVPGLFADLLVAEGDPTEDITVLERCVRLVLKEGVIEVDRRGTEPLGPSVRQLDAA